MVIVIKSSVMLVIKCVNILLFNPSWKNVNLKVDTDGKNEMLMSLYRNVTVNVKSI